MAPARKFANTEAGAGQVLPDLAFDLGEGKPRPENLGKTDMPVCVVPDLAFNLQSLPVLQVTVHVRPEAAPVQIGCDPYHLYVALNQLDLSLSGSGMMPDQDTLHTTHNGSCTLTFKPNRPEGAAQRFGQIANLINASPQTAAWLATPLSAIAGFQAKTAGPSE